MCKADGLDRLFQWKVGDIAGTVYKSKFSIPDVSST